MSSVGRVYPVPNPKVRGCPERGGVKYGLEVHKGRTEFAGESRDNLPLAFDAFGDLSDGLVERRAQDEFQRWIGVPGSLQNAVVGFLVHREVDLFAVIIHTNQNAEKIRFVCNHVLFPTFFKVQHGIAADTPVHEIEMPFGKGCAMACGDYKNIAVSEDVIGVFIPSPVSIRNGVALKKNAGACRECRNRGN